jgi:hypothetical protein
VLVPLNRSGRVDDFVRHSAARRVGRPSEADPFDGLGRPSYMVRQAVNRAMCTSLHSAGQQKPLFPLVLAVLLAGCGLTMAFGCVAEDKRPQTVTEFLKLPRVGETQQ